MVTFVVAIWPGEISSVSAVKTKRATFSGSSPRIVTRRPCAPLRLSSTAFT
jgi:hypothetical protein